MWDILKLNEYAVLYGRYSLKQENSLYCFQNTNPTILVMFILLFFHLLYQRGYQWRDLLEIIWKSVGLWGSYAWNRSIPCIFFKTLIQLYLFCLILYFWLTVSKRVSKTIFSDITFKSVGIWGSYTISATGDRKSVV